MAVYKVPQDVEADDKLIGPFSFRQFIYLVVVALAGGLAWALFQLFPLLAVIPLPVIVFFGVLALPLRKDQPMEVYLAALISFYLKPHRRLWDPDGIDSLIEITVPKTIEVQRTKNISQAEASQRFGYLAEIVDSQGWSVRGTGAQAPANTAMNSDAYFDAQQATDILDENNTIVQSLDSMISKSDEQRHEEMMERLRQAQTASAEPAVPTPVYNPYPSAMQQAIVQPVDDPSAVFDPATTAVVQPVDLTATTTSGKPVSAGIMNLVNNADDLSVETIASVANRIQQKEADLSDEVVISLR